MILKKAKRLGERLKLLAVSAVLLSFMAGVSLDTTPAFAAATYSCGTYSSGAYSNNTSCAASSGGSGTSSGNGAVGAPNTGFAKLMEPANLAAILGSLALLAAGIILLLRSRSHKKQAVSFTDQP